MRSYSDNAITKEQFESLENVAATTFSNQEYVKRQARIAVVLAYASVILASISLGISIYSVFN
jgi:hypothetical protein